MNKVMLMGRLGKDPEVLYSKGNEPIAVAKYSLAVSRKFKRDGEVNVDFINCVAFGKAAEFVEKYLSKGQMVSVVGRLQVRSYDDKDGGKRWVTEVIVEEHYFAESKKETSKNNGNYESKSNSDFAPVVDENEEDLPF